MTDIRYQGFWPGRVSDHGERGRKSRPGRSSMLSSSTAVSTGFLGCCDVRVRGFRCDEGSRLARVPQQCSGLVGDLVL